MSLKITIRFVDKMSSLNLSPRTEYWFDKKANIAFAILEPPWAHKVSLEKSVHRV